MNHLVNAISCVLAGLVGWFLYSIILDRAPPVAISDIPIVLNSQPVPRNGALSIRYHITVNRRCHGTGQRLFVDAGGTSQPVMPYSVSTGTRSDGQATVLDDPFDETVDSTVPNSAAPGQATYQNQTVFYCNFWQSLLRRGITVEYPAVVFRVGEDTLQQVKPSTSVFKRTDAGDIATWVRRHVLLASESE